MSRFSVLAHVVWEGVLLVLAVIVTVLGLAAGHVFAGPGPWPQLGILGILAGALALSLRTGTPNLALASVAPLSGLLYAVLVTAHWPVALAAAVGVLAALGFGLVLAVIVGLTGAPAWAVSLGGAALGGTIGLANGATPRLLSHGLITSSWLSGFAVLFVVGSVAGGALWLAPGVRSGLRATAVNGEPAPGMGRRFLAALVGLGGSSLLAGLAGVLETSRLAAATFTSGQFELLFALGAALLGGVSLTGRGGGIAGTALAAYLLVVIQLLLVVDHDPAWVARSLPVSVAILLGVLVSRLLDRFGSRIGPPSGAAGPTPYLPGGYPHLAYPLAGYPHPAYPGAGQIPAPRVAPPSTEPASPSTEPPPGG